jgi:AraC-like DNA-binding protein
MPTVGALVRDYATQDSVTRQLARVADVHFVENAAALIRTGVAGEVSAVITELGDESGRSIAPMIVELTARAPRVPIVLYDTLNRPAVDRLTEILVPGLSIDFVLRDVEPLVGTVRRALSMTMPPSVSAILLQRFLPLAPLPLHVFVAVAALKAPSGRGLEHLAQWSGITRRTVARRLDAAGWQAPSVLLQTFRALDAVWLMTMYGWSVRRVQELRGFSNRSSIGRLMRRYLGIAPLELRETGGFEVALEIAERAIVGNNTTVG